jgi:hypothetical protein
MKWCFLERALSLQDWWNWKSFVYYIYDVRKYWLQLRLTNVHNSLGRAVPHDEAMQRQNHASDNIENNLYVLASDAHRQVHWVLPYRPLLSYSKDNRLFSVLFSGCDIKIYIITGFARYSLSNCIRPKWVVLVLPNEVLSRDHNNEYWYLNTIFSLYYC